MKWLSQNWFFVLVFGAFVGLYLFGHGGHGGHGRREHSTTDRDDTGGDQPPERRHDHRG